MSNTHRPCNYIQCACTDTCRYKDVSNTRTSRWCTSHWVMYRGVAGEGVALSWGNKLLFSWSSAGDNTCRESLSSPVTCFNEEGLQDCHLHMKQINQSWRGKLNVLKCFWGLAPRTATYKGHIHSEGHGGESSSSRRRVYRKSNE